MYEQLYQFTIFMNPTRFDVVRSGKELQTSMLGW